MLIVLFTQVALKIIDSRLQRHDSGFVDATKHKLPVFLVTFLAFIDKYKAFEFEKYLKSGTGIAFINKHLV